MNGACPIQTPVERERSMIVSRAASSLVETVLAALEAADAATASALRATGEDVQSLRGFFTADLHQKLYCVLCGADPETLSGGDPTAAIAIIRNSQQIAKHYWGADIDPYPRSGARLEPHRTNGPLDGAQPASDAPPRR